MDGKLNVFAALTRRMSWLAQRQQVLAQNIANSDTPDYVPLDLKTGSFEQTLARRLKPATVSAPHPNHIDTRGTKTPTYRTEKQDDVYEITPSGNAVVLEEQLVKVSETQTDYQTMTNLYRKHMNMIRVALGRNTGG